MANLRSYIQKIKAGEELSEEEQGAVVKKINTYWEDHPDVGSRFPRWKKYMAWLAGHQRTDYNIAIRKLVSLPRGKQRRLVFNRMKSFVKVLLSKLIGGKIRHGVIPNTSENDDVEAARVGDKIIESLWKKLRFDSKIQEAFLWLIICNRVGFRVFWNKEDKGVIDYDRVESEDPATAEMSESLEEITEEGEIGIEVISPFHIRVDPLNYERGKWRWLVYGEEVDADELEEEYDLKEGTLVERSDVLDTAMDLEVTGSDAPANVRNTSQSEEVTGRTIVKKYFFTPDVYMISAGERLLEWGPNEENEVPLWIVEDRVIPLSNYEKGIVYNDSILKDVIPVQREYNRQVSIFSTAIERATKLKILLPMQSVLNKKSFDTDFGTFIDCNTRLGKPEQMKMDSLPAFMPAYKSDLEREFEQVFNVHPASFGQLPERASHASGSLVNILLEQDDVVLDPLIKAMDDTLSEVWSFALKLVSKYYTVGRLMEYTADDGQQAVEKFRGSDLQGNTKVQVTSQTGLPRSRALRIEYIMKLREAGLIQDDKLTLQMLEFGQAERVFQDQLVHERRAYRENSRIQKRKDIDPQEAAAWIYELEDHMIHITIHMKDRLGVKFENYTPNQQEALEMHLRSHIQVVAKQAQEQAQAAVAEEPSPEGSTSQEAGQGTPRG